jgi:hypothetical protein
MIIMILLVNNYLSFKSTIKLSIPGLNSGKVELIIFNVSLLEISPCPFQDHPPYLNVSAKILLFWTRLLHDWFKFIASEITLLY